MLEINESSEKLSLIIPVYNEEASINQVVNDWVNCLKELKINFEIHVYNDGSTDHTKNILDKMSAKNSSIKVCHKTNSGHGPTILQGYLEEAPKCDWLFQVDSDNELLPSDFYKLWMRRKDYDFLIGKRVNRKVPKVRIIISFISRLCLLLLFRCFIRDANVPYRLIRSKSVLPLIKLIPKGTFAPNILLSALISMNKLRVFQTDIFNQYRQTGIVSIRRWKLLKVSILSFFQLFLFKYSKKSLEEII